MLSPALVLAFFLYTACAVVAIVLQGHSPLLPLGLFNDGRREYELLSEAALVLLSTLLLIFGFEILRRRSTLAGRLARATLASLLLLEAALTIFDIGWVSRDSHGLFGGPYYERRTQSGDWIFLAKGPPNSEFGFRTPREEPRRSSVPRVLFLGDSYTQGSGSDLACNYPTVVEAELIRRLGTPIEVMNAGVCGYGPVDSWKLLRFLDQEGFRFDAIVFNLFLENDFTDNLPKTERRVVAGINFRFPSAWFLRFFHPLNYRVFRYALFLRTANPLLSRAPSPIEPDPHRCKTEPTPPEPMGEPLRAYVERKLETNYAGPMETLALSEVQLAVTSMQTFAATRRVPFALVVFPDRILADPALRSELRLGERARSFDLDRLQRWVHESFPSLPQIDVTAVLAGSVQPYRPFDTHLSDAGNVRAGEFVGGRLAEIFGPHLRP
jgi:hypothetical protein